MTLPTDLFYSQEHMWVKKEEGKVRIGVTKFAQEELGDIVFVELPEVGDQLEAEEPFGSVESVKTVSELYSPIGGKITKINEELEDNPEFINESPYDKAWLIVIEPSNDKELEELLTSEEYSAFIEDDE